MDLLKNFEPAKGGRYDPGQIVIFFDNRHIKGPEDGLSMLQSYWMDAKFRLGWPSWGTPDLAPGYLRLVWYTVGLLDRGFGQNATDRLLQHAGNEGSRDFPLHKAYAVKEMFDSLSEEALRPMLIGWSAENPFPMIGGSEPPVEPKQEAPKVKTTTWSGAVSGHSKAGTTPHDRVMAIIDQEEAKEAKARQEQVELAKKAEALGYGNGAV